MKKLILLATLVSAIVSGQAQCFTLRETVSNSVIKCDPYPWTFPFSIMYRAAIPVNTRIISWNSPTPVEARYLVWGFGYDSPATPYTNEAVQRIDLVNQFVPATFGATISNRFSECDNRSYSDFDTYNLREFIMEVILYKPGTGHIINRGYMRWTR